VRNFSAFFGSLAGIALIGISFSLGGSVTVSTSVTTISVSTAHAEKMHPLLRVVSIKAESRFLNDRRAAVSPSQWQSARQTDLPDFQVLGISYQSAGGGVARVRTVLNGTWSDWIEPERNSTEGPDLSSSEGSQAGPAGMTSNPVWVSDATGYEVQFPLDATDTAVHVVRDVVDGSLHARAATDPAPAIYPFGIHPRADWNARPPKIHVGMGNPLKGVQMAVIHHTATPGNDYTQAEAATLVRNFQAYDMDIRHYDDLGYNVMVDKFGGIWEGRSGGLDQAVVGAHALGFNQVATGISVIGNFVDVDPPAAVIDAVAKVAGWKLSLDGYDPLSSVTIGADETEGHPMHPVPLTTPRIVGHRDVGQTECPGRIWNHLAEIRTKAAAYAKKAPGKLNTPTQPRPKTIVISGEATPVGTTDPKVVIQIDHRAVVTTAAKFATPLAAATPPDSAPTTPPVTSTALFESDLTVEPGPHRACVYTLADDGTRSLVGCDGFTVTDPNINPIRPVRLLDTRNGAHLMARQLRPVPIAGLKTVPVEAASVSANVTVTNPAKDGYLTVVPCGSALPDETSNVNFARGQTIPALVLTKLGADGQLCLFADTEVDVVIDVTAWFPENGAFTGITPARLLDTRLPATKLAGGEERKVQVTGRGGVGLDATAAALNIVATNEKAAGWLAVYPCDVGFTGTSNVNYGAGQTIANLAVSKLSADGSVCLKSDKALDVIVDVTGWFPPGAFHPITPTRIMDTRQGLGGNRINYEDTIELKIRGQRSIPTEATSVMVNLTVTNPDTAGYLTVYPCAQVHPGTSNLNFAAHETIPNLTLTKVGINGCLRVDSGSTTDVVADAVGYFV
jgi:N-acetylmuramoyl-L-alanine amidase